MELFSSQFYRSISLTNLHWFLCRRWCVFHQYHLRLHRFPLNCYHIRRECTLSWSKTSTVRCRQPSLADKWSFRIRRLWLRVNNRLHCDIEDIEGPETRERESCWSATLDKRNGRLLAHKRDQIAHKLKLMADESCKRSFDLRAPDREVAGLCKSKTSYLSRCGIKLGIKKLGNLIGFLQKKHEWEISG